MSVVVAIVQPTLQVSVSSSRMVTLATSTIIVGTIVLALMLSWVNGSRLLCRLVVILVTGRTLIIRWVVNLDQTTTA